MNLHAHLIPHLNRVITVTTIHSTFSGTLNALGDNSLTLRPATTAHHRLAAAIIPFESMTDIRVQTLEERLAQRTGDW